MQRHVKNLILFSPSKQTDDGKRKRQCDFSSSLKEMKHVSPPSLNIHVAVVSDRESEFYFFGCHDTLQLRHFLP